VAYLTDLVTARNNAAAALAAASMRTDSPENIAKLRETIKELNALIDDAALRDETTGQLTPFEIETQDVT